VGRPDFQLLQDTFENGARFYEPQHSDLSKTNVAFRETESQIKHDAAVTA
jgi:hypothetical protein